MNKAQEMRTVSDKSRALAQENELEGVLRMITSMAHQGTNDFQTVLKFSDYVLPKLKEEGFTVTLMNSHQGIPPSAFIPEGSKLFKISW